jgi:hypothetical protein
VCDRQDDHEHEEAVAPDPGPGFGSQACGYVGFDDAAQGQGCAGGLVHFAGLGEDSEALQADDEQDKAFMAFPCLRS